MDYRVTVSWQSSAPDGRAEGILSEVRALYGGSGGAAPVQSVQVSDLYFLRGDLTRRQVEQLCHELLVDPIVQTYNVSELATRGSDGRPLFGPSSADVPSEPSFQSSALPQEQGDSRE